MVDNELWILYQHSAKCTDAGPSDDGPVRYPPKRRPERRAYFVAETLTSNGSPVERPDVNEISHIENKRRRQVPGRGVLAACSEEPS